VERSSRRPARLRAGDERGAAAVEAGLITALLSPFLMGLLGLGSALWGMQGSDAYEPRVDQAELAGSYLSCTALLDAVRNSVLVNANNVSDSTDVALDDVAARVVDFVPDQIGVDVHVSVRVQSNTDLGWLPFDHDVVLESQTRLDYAVLGVETC